MTGPHPIAGEVIDLFPDPVFIVARDGRVVAANGPAWQKFDPPDGDETNLVTFIGAEPDAVERMLDRGVRTGSSLPASLVLAGRVTGRYQVSCRRLSGHDGEPLLGIHMEQSEKSEFAALTDTVQQLRAEVRDRALAQQRLERAVSERDLLLRELQHRVKNNIQVQTVLLRRQARESENEEFRALVDVAIQRLLAIGRTYEFMYKLGNYDTLSAKALLTSTAESLEQIGDDDLRVRVNVEDDWDVPNDKATTLVLVMSELVINACKHGLQNGPGDVDVTFRRDGDVYRLTVSDPGAGFPDGFSVGSKSGLSLVSRLAGTLGGKLWFPEGPGGTCEVMIEAGKADETGDGAVPPD
ncbi:MAG: sensor histidine kinase [Alphaproteobacteria bacterium]|nr:sensor histidine kinase [Alphaproteobacteria bacterium]